LKRAKASLDLNRRTSAVSPRIFAAVRLPQPGISSRLGGLGGDFAGDLDLEFLDLEGDRCAALEKRPSKTGNGPLAAIESLSALEEHRNEKSR
jgi:hypothetical protein